VTTRVLTVDTDGATLWCDERGQGSTVLLVHGGLFDPMDGERFWIAPGVADDLAAAGYRVLTPDRRYGAGGTTSDFRAHSWDIEAADLAAVLAAAGGAPAHVVAGSNGCSAAIRLALTQPERVRSLTLCWPATLANAALLAQFERSAAFVAEMGPAGYLAELRAHDLPRPSEDRPGFPYGAALLRDARLATSFLAQPPTAAAQTLRATAAALLPGELLRGVSHAAARRLAASRLPLAIVPPEPEDAAHTRAATRALVAALPGARRMGGTPVTPSPHFARSRAACAAMLRGVLRGATQHDAR
jgi:pimeloyl-ACP methyl ester carboxylesterase